MKVYRAGAILPKLEGKPLFSMASGGVYAIADDGSFRRMDSLRHRFKGRARKKARMKIRKGEQL